jgi:hypothetical protein
MHICKEVKAKRYDNAKQYDACRKDVQHKTVTANRIHESGPYLHTDGVYKEDQAEFLNKVKNVRFDTESQMAKADAYEKGSCATERDSLDLDFSDHEAECGGERDC